MTKKKSNKSNKDVVENAQDFTDGAFMSLEDKYYEKELSVSKPIFETLDREDDVLLKKKFRCQSLQFPGDEPVLEKIMNSSSCTILNKIITPMPKEGILMVYVEWEESL